jgi:hypothetical protein
MALLFFIDLHSQMVSIAPACIRCAFILPLASWRLMNDTVGPPKDA